VQGGEESGGRAPHLAAGAFKPEPASDVRAWAVATATAAAPAFKFELPRARPARRVWGFTPSSSGEPAAALLAAAGAPASRGALHGSLILRGRVAASMLRRAAAGRVQVTVDPASEPQVGGLGECRGGWGQELLP
jgi:hypothetical protein